MQTYRHKRKSKTCRCSKKRRGRPKVSKGPCCGDDLRPTVKQRRAGKAECREAIAEGTSEEQYEEALRWSDMQDDMARMWWVSGHG